MLQRQRSIPSTPGRAARRIGLCLAAVAGLAACASDGDQSRVTGASVGDVNWAFADIETLEAKIDVLTRENNALHDRLAELKERLSEAEATAEAAVTEAADLRAALQTRDRPSVAAAPNPAPAPVISAPNADVASPDAPVPVEQAPRLVQPTFASAEPVFENEVANGDVALSSVLWGVHLDSYSRVQYAREGWRRLQREHPDELGLLEPRTERIMIEGKGVMFRLIGGGFASEAKATALCESLAQKRQYCRVVTFDGERLAISDPS